MTLSGAKARYQLNTGATPTGTNITNAVRIGEPQTTAHFTTADIAYSFIVTAAADSNVAKLHYSNSVVTQVTGSPTITDGDGNDFEGVDIPDLATLYAVLVNGGSSNDGSVRATSAAAGLDDAYVYAGSAALWFHAAGLGITTDTLSLTFSNATDTCEVTVIGKTT